MKEITISKNRSEKLILDVDEDVIITLEDNAKLTILELKNSGNITFNLEMNSLLHSSVLCTDKSKYERKINLMGQNAKVIDSQGFFGNEQNKIKTNTIISHYAPKTFSRSSMKSIVKDSSSVICLSSIKIEKNSLNCDTDVQCHSLILSKDSKVKTAPILEIEPSQVKAGHAASCKKISSDELFFLSARGLDVNQAKKLLAKSFFMSAFVENGYEVECEKKFEEAWL